MKGRRPGRPTKWVYATVNEKFYLGKAGLVLEVWKKWKQRGKKLGTSYGERRRFALGTFWRESSSTRLGRGQQVVFK